MIESAKFSRRALWMQKLADEVFRGARPRPYVAYNRICSEPRRRGKGAGRLVDEGLPECGADRESRVAAKPVAESFEIPRIDAVTLAGVIAIIELRIALSARQRGFRGGAKNSQTRSVRRLRPL